MKAAIVAFANGYRLPCCHTDYRLRILPSLPETLVSGCPAAELTITR